MKLTDEQRLLLSEHESVLKKARDKRVILHSERRNILPKLKLIYESITGHRVKSGCSSCGGTIRWLEALAKIYYDDKGTI